MLFVDFKMGMNVFVEMKNLLLMICYQTQIVTFLVRVTLNECVEQVGKITSSRNQV